MLISFWDLLTPYAILFTEPLIIFFVYNLHTTVNKVNKKIDGDFFIFQ
jgi:hypothetical protein